ncbi:hypothetical protein LDDCCGHA_4335 [Methylobacterium oxalidis]|nr:hypothetical protein LDDCCGHA_4335 [Methylobacterium oxalidis]
MAALGAPQARPGRHGLGREVAARRQAAPLLEGGDRRGDAGIVILRLAGAGVEAARRAPGQPEAGPDQGHARVAHPELQDRARGQRRRGAGRAALAKRGEAGPEGEVARVLRVVALQEVARSLAAGGDLAEHRLGGGQVEDGGDQAGQGGRVEASAPRVAGVEGDDRRELEVGLRDLGLGLGPGHHAEDRHRVGGRVEPVLARTGEAGGGGLGGRREGAVRDPDRLEGAERVESLDRLALLRGETGQERRRVGEARGDSRRLRVGGRRRRLGRGRRLGADGRLLGLGGRSGPGRRRGLGGPGGGPWRIGCGIGRPVGGQGIGPDRIRRRQGLGGRRYGLGRRGRRERGGLRGLGLDLGGGRPELRRRGCHQGGQGEGGRARQAHAGSPGNAAAPPNPSYGYGLKHGRVQSHRPAPALRPPPPRSPRRGRGP